MPGNFPSATYDPNAFLAGAKGAIAFDQLTAQRKAMQQQQQGDTSGAVSTLNNTNQYDLANQAAAAPYAQKAAQNTQALSDQSVLKGQFDINNAQHKQEMEAINQVTSYLNNIRSQHGDAAVPGAFAQLKPYLTQMGLDEGTYNTIADQLANNPNFLDAIHQQSLIALGNRLVDKNTGQVVVDAPPAASTAKPQVITKQNADGTYSAFQVKSDGNGQVYLEPLAVGQQLPGSAAPQPPGAFTEDSFAAALQGIAPGAQVTSGLRTAEENARVGGVPTSNHLTGNAADVTPPPGMSYTDFNKLLQAQGFHTILEHGPNQVTDPTKADHIHVDFNGRHPGSQPTPTTGDAYKFGGKPPSASQANVMPSDEQLTQYAQQLAAGASLGDIVRGRGGATQGVIDAIYARGKELYGDQFNPVAAKAGLKADTAALQQTAKQTGLSVGFERAANAAIALVPKYDNPKFHPTGIPLIDQQWIQAKLQSGDKDAQPLLNAINTVTEEYAKVMTGANGSAAATDSARRTAKERLIVGFSKGQMQAALDQLRAEMQARTQALQGNVSDLRSQAGAVPGLPSAAPQGQPSLDEIFKGVQ